MIYAVIDTNVLVSALLSRHSDAATVQVVKAVFEKNILPLYNDEIIAEYELPLCLEEQIADENAQISL